MTEIMTGVNYYNSSIHNKILWQISGRLWRWLQFCNEITFYACHHVSLATSAGYPTNRIMLNELDNNRCVSTHIASVIIFLPKWYTHLPDTSFDFISKLRLSNCWFTKIVIKICICCFLFIKPSIVRKMISKNKYKILQFWEILSTRKIVLSK